ncbi:MAG: hypothetical protein ACRDZ5_01400 [Acidimicrobiales bacterium]
MSVVQEEIAFPDPIPVQIGGVRGGPPRTETLRVDRWWLQPLLVVLGLTGFVVYGVWTAFRGHGYFTLDQARDYLSPFYSPCFVTSCPTEVVWGPAGNIGAVSPALLVLIFPMGFRLTCYYYRKAYYRSFWASPPACAVADVGSGRKRRLRSRYTGETRFPLIWQNVHRYFFYIAVIFAGILSFDAVIAFRFPGGVGMALGSLIFVVNAVLIWAYTLGCHACRHLCGGGAKLFSASPVRFRIWRSIVNPLNAHHQLFAWMSLIWIAWTDFYVYLVSMNMLHDPRFF